MEEQEVIKNFRETLKTYPFKTRLIEEYHVDCGVVDIYLEDYDVFIEAKGSDGDIKRAIGQAICYKEYGERDWHTYILIPQSKLQPFYVDVCKENDIGIILINERHGLFNVHNDVGGLNSFNFNYSKIENSNIDKRTGYAKQWLIGCNESKVIERH